MKIYLNFDLLRKEVLNLIPNFTKLNELPSFKEIKIIIHSTNFLSEEINIKRIRLFFY